MVLSRIVRSTLPLWLASLASADVLHVDQSVPTSGNGTTWSQAFKSLAAAIDLAKDHPAITEIWVAEGIYRPGNLRTDSFVVLDGVTYLGGFPAGGGSLASRDGKAHPTVLTGNVGLQSTSIDNAYHVLTAYGVDAARLDGFRIADGVANEPPSSWTFGGTGGALLLSGSNVTISNCEIFANRGLEGGAVAVLFQGLVEFVDCEFHDNTTSSWGGGAVTHFGTEAVVFDRCSFWGNSAAGSGGAIETHGPLEVFSSIFDGNTSSADGGAIAMPSNDSSMLLASLKISGCTFVANTAARGGAIAKLQDAWTIVSNSLVWSNSASAGSVLFDTFPTTTAWSHCNATPTSPSGFVVVDPAFADANGPDDVAGNRDDDLRLLPTSACRDAGANWLHPADRDLDFLGRARIRNGNPLAGAIIDLGACEATLKASGLAAK